MVVEERRFVGIDLGKRTWETAVITRSGKMKKNAVGDLEPEEKTEFAKGVTTVEGRMSRYKKLKPGDKVCLEAGNLAFIMAKEIEKSVGCQIRVLNPSHLPIIYATDNKTDKGDALKLAHLLTDRPDSRLPVVPVPDEREMRRRKILGSYRREKQSRIRLINQLHALFVRQGIVTVVRKDLVTDERRRETVAFAYVSYINPNRFENGSQVGNYLGLVPRVDISGSLVHYGGITKRGNGYLRSMLVQGAWALTRSKTGGALKERYEYMTKVKGKGKKKAIVATARKLGEVMYAVMKNGSEYEERHYKAEAERQRPGILMSA